MPTAFVLLTLTGRFSSPTDLLLTPWVDKAQETFLLTIGTCCFLLHFLFNYYWLPFYFPLNFNTSRLVLASGPIVLLTTLDKPTGSIITGCSLCIFIYYFRFSWSINVCIRQWRIRLFDIRLYEKYSPLESRTITMLTINNIRLACRTVIISGTEIGFRSSRFLNKEL